MLHLVRNNNPLTVLILSIYGVAINWPVLFNPQLPQIPEQDFLYRIITNFLNVIFFGSAFAFTLFSIVLLILQALYLNAVANKHKLFTSNTYLVAFVYISFTSLYMHFGIFSQPLLLNWIIILLIDYMLQLAQAQKPRKLIYNAGFVVGVGALLIFPALFYVLLLIVSISLLRNFNPVEMVVALLGVLTPIYFAAGLLYLFDAFHWLLEWLRLGFNLPRRIENPVYVITMFAGVLLLFAMGVYTLQRQMSRAGVFVRRGWTSMAVCLFVSIISAMLTDYEVKAGWLLTMPVLSLVSANAYNNEKNKAFSNFAFYFTLLLVIFCHIAISST